MWRAAIIGLAVNGLALGGASAARAERQVTGNIGAITISENVFVPPNQSCSMTGTTVNGQIRLGAHATLTLTGGKFNGDIKAKKVTRLELHNSQINGDIKFSGGQSGAGAPVFLLDGVTVNGATAVGPVTGPVSLSACTLFEFKASAIHGSLDLDSDTFQSSSISLASVSGDITVNAITVEGSMKVTKLGSGSMSITAVTVNKDLQLLQNHGAITIVQSTIEGNLKASKNVPPPAVAASTDVDGSIIGSVTHTP
jgi:DUF4097 and DUF4098 domain-containing protein YvlB